MTTLLPRMSRIAVDTTLTLLREDGKAKDISESVTALPNWATYAPVGGTKATSSQLKTLREEVLALANDCQGAGRGPQTARASFDARVSAFLAPHPLLSSGEALRDDVWAFIASYLMCSVTKWRFGVNSPERYYGGVRNTFQRLWMRGRALDRGEEHADRWGLIERLTEDALVQITERPSLGSNRRLARGIAEGWVRTSEQLGAGAMENVMRRAIMGIRLRNEVFAIAMMPDAEAVETIDQEFERAAKHLG